MSLLLLLRDSGVINTTSSNTIAGAFRIQASPARSIAGLSRIGRAVSKNIAGAAKIIPPATNNFFGYNEIGAGDGSWDGCWGWIEGPTGTGYVCPGTGPQTIVALETATHRTGANQYFRMALIDSDHKVVCQWANKVLITNDTVAWVGSGVPLSGNTTLQGGARYFLACGSDTGASTPCDAGTSYGKYTYAIGSCENGYPADVTTAMAGGTSYNTFSLRAKLSAPLPAFDYFNRADETPMGGNWTSVGATATGRINLTSGTAVGDIATGDCISYWNASTFSDDQWSQVTIATATANRGGGPALHLNYANRSGVVLVGFQGVVRFALINNGAWEAWQSGGTTYIYNVQPGDVLRAECKGNEYYGYVNGVLRAQFTNSIHPTGPTGIYIFNGITFSNWSGGNSTVNTTTTGLIEGVSSIRNTSSSVLQGVARIQTTAPNTVIVNYDPAYRNGGFETGYTDYWQINPGGGSVSNSTDVRPGTKGTNSIRMDGTNGWVGLYNMDLIPGRRYKISFWAKGLVVNPTVGIYVGLRVDTLSLTSSWAQYSVEYVNPNLWYFGFMMDSGKIALFDDVVVTECGRSITGTTCIRTSNLKTISGQSRIYTSAVVQTIAGKTDIRQTNTQNISATATIRKTTSSIIDGRAYLIVTESTQQTIVGIANIKATAIKTIIAQSRIQKSIVRTIAAQARLTDTNSYTIVAKASIRKTNSVVLSSVARLQNRVIVSIVSKAAIKTSTIRSINGSANIKNKTVQTTVALARLQKTAPVQSIAGMARIRITVTKTLTAISRITVNSQNNLHGISAIRQAAIKTISSIGRIQKTAPLQNIEGIAQIRVHVQQVITGISHIRVRVQKLLVGKANIAITTQQALASIGRIQVTSSATITGCAFVKIVVRRENILGCASVIAANLSKYPVISINIAMEQLAATPEINVEMAKIEHVKDTQDSITAENSKDINLPSFLTLPSNLGTI